MTRIILTGAGFSHNWGGWLASEAMEYLLGCPEITQGIRATLWKHKPYLGFEGALEELALQSTQDYQTLNRMLEGMFNAMNNAFGDFEPGQHNRIGPQPTSVRNFLCRFDAIFTLNQDTLLERKYQTSDVREGSSGRWLGFHSPGLFKEMNAGVPTGYFRPHDPPFALKERYQSYFKLHGSSNWRTPNGSSLLIMGLSKNAVIDGIELLSWYRRQFEDMLHRPDTHLMIIGYSFRDKHINEIILKGARNGTKLFIIDPRGVDVLENIDSRAFHLGSEDRSTLQNSILGASRRPFLTSVSNQIEMTKINRFFPLFP